MKNLFKKETNTYLNYLIIAYAFSFPISKAAVNILEVLMLLLWIYQGEWKHKYELLKAQRFMLFLGAFIVYMFISIPWASDTAFALKYIAKYHHFLVIPVIYTALERKYIKYVFVAFVASVFISEIMSYGIYFNLFTYKHATHEFPTPFMHHITYSVVLVFTSMILLTNFVHQKKLGYKIFEILFFTTIITNLFINGGRTGQVIFIVIMFVVSLMYIKHKLKAILSASAVIFITFFLAYNFSSNFPVRVHQFEHGISKIIHNDDYTGQGGMRAALWIVGSEVFLDNPIVGTGIGNEMKDANHYASLHSFKTKDMNGFSDYHNVFVNVAAQLGIIGLSFILLIFYSLFKLPFKTKQYKVLNTVFVISFILFSCTHNTVHLMFPMVFFALFTGIFSAISRIESSKTLLQ